MATNSRWWFEKPKFDVDVTEDKNGKWHWVLKHHDGEKHVDAVSNVRGYETPQQAMAAAQTLAGGFELVSSNMKPYEPPKRGKK